MSARTRSRSTRVLGACAAALTAAALLGACGSDDSTATSTPSATTSAAATTEAAATTTTARSDAEPTGTEPTGTEPTGTESTETAQTETQAPFTSPGEAATAPPAEPQTAPGFPGPTAIPAEDRDAAFLDALRAAGIEPADEFNAINTANYICGALAQGGSDDEISTFVTALVGSDAVASGAEITEEQAAEAATIYIATARETYCS